MSKTINLGKHFYQDMSEKIWRDMGGEGGEYSFIRQM